MRVLLLLLDSTGEGMWKKYEVPEALNGLDELIQMQQSTLSLLPADDADRPEVFGRLGDLWLIRYDRASRPNDLRNAISLYQQAIQTTPSDDSSVEEWHQNLKSAFDNLNSSISIQRQVLDRTSGDDPRLPMLLNGLVIFLGTRWERFREVDDLNNAIFAQRRALELTPENDSEMPAQLASLGHLLFSRFKRLEKLDDLDGAIWAQCRALEFLSEDSPVMLKRLDNLVESLRARFKSLNELSDLDNTIETSRRALKLTPKDDPNMQKRFDILGLVLLLRFRRLGELNDLENAISMMRNAIELTPEDHSFMSLHLCDLGAAFCERFERLGELSDIYTAIELQLRPFKFADKGHPVKPMQLANLGKSFLFLFRRLGRPHEINQAILIYQRAANIVPEDNPSLPGYLNGLAVALIERFKHSKQLGDLDSAILAHRRAVELSPKGSDNLPLLLSNLGTSLCIQLEFKHQSYRHAAGEPVCTPSELGDLESAVLMHRQAFELTLTHGDHSDRLNVSRGLGRTLMTYFCFRRNQSNFDAAVQWYRDCLLRSGSLPSERLLCAQSWAWLETVFPEFGSPESLLQAHSSILSTFPESIWLGHNIARRYRESAQVTKYVNRAVSAAIGLNRLQLAVEWLDAGRCLIWSQILALRTPVGDLALCYHDLAQKWQDLSSKLQHAHLTQLPEPSLSELSLSLSSSAISLLGDQTSQHRTMVVEYEDCLKKIRACPGFGQFLRPQALVDLTSMAERLDGPVVFIHVSSSRCDALVLSRGGTVALVPLPDLTQDGADELRVMFMAYLQSNDVRQRMPAPTSPPDNAESGKISTVLDLLWKWVVRPVLMALEYVWTDEPISKMFEMMYSRDTKLPHITWCPTGPLAQLPLHAAGAHRDSGPSGPHAYNFVVSSYTPSLAALVRAQEGFSRAPSSPKTLIVTQPYTPNQSELPGTATEGVVIQKILYGSRISNQALNGDVGTVESVEAGMSKFSWVHFACHGMQHPSDPTKSAFRLHNGELTLSTLMRTVAPSAELAFLSACQTASGDEKAPEESAHLTAGMLAVGFVGVIGTLWSVIDEDAPIVVEAYYKNLLELRRTNSNAQGSTGAAYALHEAVKHLRLMVGDENFLSWAPFVHYGV